MSEKKQKKKTPWHTQKAMQQVYAQGLWGSNGALFYSGEGSHDTYIVQPYLEVVQSYLASFEQPLTVCDLGCGDFKVGRELVAFSEKLIAVDIVPELIDYHKKKIQDAGIEFRCLDVAKDVLPKTDVAILRQVLQHLSNAEIEDILLKLPQYKYVILTEHIPQGDFEPNLDIISGQGIRLKKESGVVIDQAPFDCKYTSARELLRVIPCDEKGVIVTTLFVMPD